MDNQDSRRNFCKALSIGMVMPLTMYTTQSQAYVLPLARMAFSLIKGWRGRAVATGVLTGLAKEAVSSGLKQGGFTENWKEFQVENKPVITAQKPHKPAAQCLAIATSEKGNPAMIEGASILMLDKFRNDYKVSNSDFKDLTMPVSLPIQNQVGDIYIGYDKAMKYRSKNALVTLDWSLINKQKKIGQGTYIIQDLITGKVYKGDSGIIQFT